MNNPCNPLLIEMPFPITTPRLTMRPMMPGDGKAVFEAIQESRQCIRTWLTWVDDVKTWCDSEVTARQFYADFIMRQSCNLVIFHHDRFIGSCGFNKIDWDISTAAIGYWCRTSAQGNGFIHEALTAQIKYGFGVMGFKRITAICDDRNAQSIRVLERLSFQLETRVLGLIGNNQGGALVIGRQYVLFNNKASNA